MTEATTRMSHSTDSRLTAKKMPMPRARTDPATGSRSACRGRPSWDSLSVTRTGCPKRAHPRLVRLRSEPSAELVEGLAGCELGGVNLERIAHGPVHAFGLRDSHP
jgi:hypothetical protein